MEAKLRLVNATHARNPAFSGCVIRYADGLQPSRMVLCTHMTFVPLVESPTDPGAKERPFKRRPATNPVQDGGFQSCDLGTAVLLT